MLARIAIPRWTLTEETLPGVARILAMTVEDLIALLGTEPSQHYLEPEAGSHLCWIGEDRRTFLVHVEKSPYISTVSRLLCKIQVPYLIREQDERHQRMIIGASSRFGDLAQMDARDGGQILVPATIDRDGALHLDHGSEIAVSAYVANRRAIFAGFGPGATDPIDCI